MLDQARPTEILIRRLQRSTDLTDDQLETLRVLPVQVTEYRKNDLISREGDQLHHCVLILDGFLARFQDTREGRRQILSFYVPGDIPDLQTLHLRTMDHSLASITSATLGLIPHEALHALCDRNRPLAAALWRETLIDASVTRTWLRCVGRFSAQVRLAHMLCELYARLDAVGLAKEPVRMPITQAEFADAAGLSVVQVNLTLRGLREAGLISIQRREMIIHDMARLQEVAEFDPLYLHLDPRERR